MSNETNFEKGTAGEPNERSHVRQRELGADTREMAETGEELAAREARAARESFTDHLPPVIIKSGSLEIETRMPLPLFPADSTMRDRPRRYRHTGFTIKRLAAINGDGQTLWVGNTTRGCKVDLWLMGRIDAAEPQLSLDGNPLDIDLDDFLVPGGLTLPGFRPYLYRHLGTNYNPADFLIKRIRLTVEGTVCLDTLAPRIRVHEGAQIWLWREPLT